MKFIEKYPKISVITPNYNQGDFIEKTIQSVLDQKYPNLEYIIIDGGSTDNSIEIIKKYQDKLSYWTSKKDSGMYDALNIGFAKSTGDIMCWINSDDILWKKSLETIALIFTSNSQVKWLQGYPSVIDEQENLKYQRKHVFSKMYFYLLKHETSFAFIQQESTVWSRDLWEKAGGYLNLDYKLASDFDLWMRFFKYENLYCTNKQLAAFRTRIDQMSSDKNTYLIEVKKSIKENYKNLNLINKIIIKSIIFFKTNVKNKFIKRIINKVSTLLIGKPKMV
ncbi:glycosyltransferase family 2 protein [Urechidicola croceus]|uniref:Glycosyltransferase 2-like domain-containing protein n=1 Tax=Urechidicola croceus TaxID=1850246 RepID=A0A1D8P4J6_9FLAO|nr:glycosyltransferase family 2 protein [Urechidicola croceus]AOW19503.1 hypothetical protein LPB138_01875 [Urechidicola croceus]